jgi:hypothetical protein
MPQIQNMKTMTLDEKLNTIVKNVELEKQGRFGEAKRVRRQAPLAPYLAKFYKEHLGLDNLLKAGFNLSEAVAEYGSDFITN